MLDKVVDNIKETIGIEKFDDSKILIDADDKIPNYITLKKWHVSLRIMLNFIHKHFQKKHCIMDKHNTKHIKKDK